MNEHEPMPPFPDDTMDIEAILASPPPIVESRRPRWYDARFLIVITVAILSVGMLIAIFALNSEANGLRGSASLERARAKDLSDQLTCRSKLAADLDAAAAQLSQYSVQIIDPLGAFVVAISKADQAAFKAEGGKIADVRANGDRIAELQAAFDKAYKARLDPNACPSTALLQSGQ